MADFIRDPKGHINVRILHVTNLKAQDKRFSRNHDLYDPCAYVVLWAARIPKPEPADLQMN